MLLANCLLFFRYTWHDKKTLYVLLSCLCFLSITPPISANTTDTNITTIPVPIQPLSVWQERKFVDYTRYSLITDEGLPAIKANSQASASMLYQKMDIDLEKTPFLQWQWKVTRTFTDIDEKTKNGDDYPARIYIAVKGKFGSLYPRAINYVWSSTSPKGTHWASAYTSSTILIAQQSGNALSNQWVSEKVNLREDLQRYFKKDFKNIKGIAIMTDSDNMKENAVSFYRELSFSSQ